MASPCSCVLGEGECSSKSFWATGEMAMFLLVSLTTKQVYQLQKVGTPYEARRLPGIGAAWVFDRQQSPFSRSHLLCPASLTNTWARPATELAFFWLACRFPTACYLQLPPKIKLTNLTKSGKHFTYHLILTPD